MATASLKKIDLEEAFQNLKMGASEVLLESELKEKLKKSIETGVPLKIKAGFDPTSLS